MLYHGGDTCLDGHSAVLESLLRLWLCRYGFFGMWSGENQSWRIASFGMREAKILFRENDSHEASLLPIFFVHTPLCVNLQLRRVCCMGVFEMLLPVGQNQHNWGTLQVLSSSWIHTLIVHSIQFINSHLQAIDCSRFLAVVAFSKNLPL